MLADILKKTSSEGATVKIPLFRTRRKAVDLPKLRGRTPVLRSFFSPVFWGTSDNDKLQEQMEVASKLVAPGFHFADNFFTWARNNSMLDDPAFVKAWDTNAESESDKAIIWRRYILACAAYHCIQLDGDFVECGAYTGVGVKTIVDYLGGRAFPREFWLYDLFDARGRNARILPCPITAPTCSKG